MERAPAPVSQSAEEDDLKSLQCRFESDQGHPSLVEPVSPATGVDTWSMTGQAIAIQPRIWQADVAAPLP